MASSADQAMEEDCLLVSRYGYVGNFEYYQQPIPQILIKKILDDRRSSLADPHTSTLRWTLEAPGKAVEGDWDAISDWLESGSNIY